MIEKVCDIDAIERILDDHEIRSDRIRLYLELARVSPSTLVLLRNSNGCFTLYKESGRKATTPSMLIEHYAFYRAGGGGLQGTVACAEVQDILDRVAADYDDIWLSYDNLAPNDHVCDDEFHRYNLLPLRELTYDGYLAQLNSNSRLNLRKALAKTADAQAIRYAGREEVAEQIQTLIRDHYRAKYGDDSLLWSSSILDETLIAARLFNTHLQVLRLGADYSFILYCEIDGSLYVLFVGGTNAFLIKRAYHAFIVDAIENWPGVGYADAASDYPFLKKQMGFRQVSYFALIKGESNWRKFLF